MIVDAHHHFLDPKRIDYPFLRFLPELDRFTGPEELAPLREAAGVDATVAVQAADCEEETVFLLQAAARTGWVAGVVGWVPLAEPEAAVRALDRHRGLSGVRHLIHDEPDPDWVVQRPVLESLGELARRGMPFDLSAFEPRHLEHVRTFAEELSELDVVICHLGVPRLNEEQWEPWASAFAAAAANPRAHVKISGLDMTIGAADPARWQRYVDHALEHFGPSRMIWATNWPVSLRGRGYAELLDAGRAVTAGCSAAERALIFGANAGRVYRLGPGA